MGRKERLGRGICREEQEREVVNLPSVALTAPGSTVHVSIRLTAHARALETRMRWQIHATAASAAAAAAAAESRGDRPLFIRSVIPSFRRSQLTSLVADRRC